ncbi:chitin synthase-domain-containing protein [Mycena rebaudengoi]|nr:chitin synthase-domain-containing protein [Mycena rebaudengoi]
MMQVYEYFISHNMAKAFEVSSAPSPVSPVASPSIASAHPTPHARHSQMISNQLIADSSENRVDTLHMKNLLHLGEDRCLRSSSSTSRSTRRSSCATPTPTPSHPTTGRSCSRTVVAGSPRPLFLEQLCGFCRFSMRFIVMTDPAPTPTQPAPAAHLAYILK